MAAKTTFIDYTHTDGLSRLSYHPDATQLYTVGAEGYVRIFPTTNAVEKNKEGAGGADAAAGGPVKNEMIEYHQDAVTSVSLHADLICTASETGEVTLHQRHTQELVTLLTRCSFPVRSARFDPKGRRVAVASDELIVKVVDVKDPTKISLLTGHKKAVRESSWSPDGSLLTTSSSDGTIRVWELTGAEWTCVKSIEGIIEARDSDDLRLDSGVEVVWHPNGKYFVVPSKTNELVMFSRDSWTRTAAFSHKDTLSKPTSALAFSPNGSYLASASGENVFIWSTTAERKIVARTTQDSIITTLGFNPSPTRNEISWIDEKGKLYRWDQVVPSNLPGPTFGYKLPSTSSSSNKSKSRMVEDEASEDELVEPRASQNGVKKSAPLVGEEEEEEDWLDDGLDDALAKIDLPSFGQGGGGGSMNGGIMEGEDDLMKGFSDVDGGDDGEEEEEDEADRKERKARAREKPLPPRLTLAGGRTWSADGSGGVSRSGRGSNVRNDQRTFQPGSTPLKDGRRYLAFNMLGLIHSVETSDESIYTIEFHDRSMNQGKTLNRESTNWTMAALGELAAVFACPASSSSSDFPSQLTCRFHDSWNSEKRWTLSLPIGESVTSIAIGGLAASFLPTDDEGASGLAGSGTILCATDKGYIRFFSASGIQKYVWNLGEEVVAMSGGIDWAIVVWKEGSGLEYGLVDTDTFEVVQQGRLPLLKGASLKWVGFTEDQAPVMYDSNGLFSLLDRSRRPKQARWVPVLDTNLMTRRENKQESYWPVGVTEQHVHAIILKGEDKHPGFPTPLFQDLDLEIPLLRGGDGQGQLEQSYMRDTLFVSHRRDGASADDYSLLAQLGQQELNIDKHLINLIGVACKASNLEKAFDAALLLTQTKSLESALKIARFYTMPAVEERLELLIESRSGKTDAERREGKWSHLVDERSIVDSRFTGNGGGGGGSGGGGGGGFFSGGGAMLPPSSSVGHFASSARPPPPSSTFGRPSMTPAKNRSNGPSTSATKKITSSGGGAEMLDSFFVEKSDGVEDESMEVEREGSGEVEETQVEEEMEEQYEEERDEVRELEEQAPVVSKKPDNPFSKRVAAVTAKATPSKLSSKGSSSSLKKTGSFFGRLEGLEPPKTKPTKPTKARSSEAPSSSAALPTLATSRQPTLFGAKPPTISSSAAPKSKKRKSTGGVDTEATTASLDSFLKKPKGVKEVKELPREGDEFEETQVEETQEESQVERERRKKQKKKAEKEKAQEQEEDEEMSETQEEEESPRVQKENVNSRPAATSGVSKLDKYKRQEPAAIAPVVASPAPATETEPTTTTETEE